MTGRARRVLLRTARHAGFAAVGTAIIAVVVELARYEDGFEPQARMSLAAAYAGLLFFAATLMVGPFYVWRGRTLPVSSTLRRDLGIWTGIHALMHTLIGLEVYYPGEFWRNFVNDSGTATMAPRTDLLGWANHTDLLAALLVLMLLCLSNDFALKRLTLRRWKSLQRWAYGAAGLTVLHGWLYQIYERRLLGFVASLAAIVLAIVLAQAWGASRRRRARPQA